MEIEEFKMAALRLMRIIGNIQLLGESNGTSDKVHEQNGIVQEE